MALIAGLMHALALGTGVSWWDRPCCVVWCGVCMLRDVGGKLGDRRRRWLRGGLGSWEDDTTTAGLTTLCGRLYLLDCVRTAVVSENIY
jgi:hypothetical protein